VLVVGDRDGSDVARHLWGHRELTRFDESIVSRLEPLGAVPIDGAAGRGR
jgi:hypothetical protein